jgi:hypothetical protein
MRSAFSALNQSRAETKWDSAFAAATTRSQRRGKRGAHQQSLARLGIFAKPLADARQNARAEIGVEIASERNHRLPLPDFCERGGDAHAQPGPARQRDLSIDVADRGAVDKLGVGQHRRARQHH